MAYKSEGHDNLWGWFSCSRASFLVLPRVLMHEMPDEWQGKMAELLQEADDMFPAPVISEFRVNAVENGKLVKMPDCLKNYRHPDYDAIEKMKVSKW